MQTSCHLKCNNLFICISVVGKDCCTVTFENSMVEHNVKNCQSQTEYAIMLLLRGFLRQICQEISQFATITLHVSWIPILLE